MNKFTLIAGAAAMAFTMPAMAEAQGKGKGASAKAQSSVQRNARSNGQARSTVKARTDARANVRARTRTGASINRTADINGNGIADYREARIDMNRDGVDDRVLNRYGGHVCPPGLANRTPACVPPRQAKRMFEMGQRLPMGYDRYFTNYNDIPVAYRSQVPYLDTNRYIYRDNRVYIIDPTTRLVTRIIDLVL